MENKVVDYVHGKIKSPGTGELIDLTIHSYAGYSCSLSVNHILPDGSVEFIGFSSGGSHDLKCKIRKGDYLLFIDSQSSSLVAVQEVTESSMQRPSTPNVAILPNTIGNPPSGTDENKIPADPPEILVGQGYNPNPKTGGFITRTQTWIKTDDSFTLLPGESREEKITEYEGVSKSSSSEETIAASLGLKAGAKWGVISAEISGSLTKSAGHSDKIEITSYREVVRTKRFSNESKDETLFVLGWQLVDTIYINDSQANILSSLQNENPPVYLTKTYYHDRQTVEAAG